MTRRPNIPTADVRHDQDEVTFAVTFKWERPWAMDHCEVGVLSRQLREAIVKELFGEETMVAELVAVETWEPNEERHIGGTWARRNIPLKGDKPTRPNPLLDDALDDQVEHPDEGGAGR